jgi:hypothetical protein
MFQLIRLATVAQCECGWRIRVGHIGTFAARFTWRKARSREARVNEQGQPTKTQTAPLSRQAAQSVSNDTCVNTEVGFGLAVKCHCFGSTVTMGFNMMSRELQQVAAAPAPVSFALDEDDKIIASVNGEEAGPVVTTPKDIDIFFLLISAYLVRSCVGCKAILMRPLDVLFYLLCVLAAPVLRVPRCRVVGAGMPAC